MRMTTEKRSSIMKHLGGAAALAMVLALGACGTSTQDRALSGGAIGAGAGALGGAAVGRPVGGAVLGGAAGAATGAFTDDDQINLGRPWWRR